MKPHRGFDGKPLKPKGKTEADRPGNDARSSVGKHAWEALRREPSEPQMQRVARSWKVVQRRPGRTRRKAALRRGGTESPERRLKDGLGTARWKEKVRSACRGGPNQPPDGTGRRRMSRARNAGPQGPPEVKVAGKQEPQGESWPDPMRRASRCWHPRCDGTRGALTCITAVALPNTPGKAIAQTQPEQTPTSVGLVATPAPLAVERQDPLHFAKPNGEVADAKRLTEGYCGGAEAPPSRPAGAPPPRLCFAKTGRIKVRRTAGAP
jgi:hypothetical protein